MQKFKKGDIVYAKVWLQFDHELMKVLSWNDSKQMYLVIVFLDNTDPSFWRWSYVAEDDLELASSIMDVSYYENWFKEDPILYPRLYMNFYEKSYYWAKKVQTGEWTKDRFAEEVLKDYERFRANQGQSSYSERKKASE